MVGHSVIQWRIRKKRKKIFLFDTFERPSHRSSTSLYNIYLLTLSISARTFLSLLSLFNTFSFFFFLPPCSLEKRCTEVHVHIMLFKIDLARALILTSKNGKFRRSSKVIGNNRSRWRSISISTMSRNYARIKMTDVILLYIIPRKTIFCLYFLFAFSYRFSRSSFGKRPIDFLGIDRSIKQITIPRYLR